MNCFCWQILKKISLFLRRLSQFATSQCTLYWEKLIANFQNLAFLAMLNLRENHKYRKGHVKCLKYVIHFLIPLFLNKRRIPSPIIFSYISFNNIIKSIVPKKIINKVRLKNSLQNSAKLQSYINQTYCSRNFSVFQLFTAFALEQLLLGQKENTDSTKYVAGRRRKNMMTLTFVYICSENDIFLRVYIRVICVSSLKYFSVQNNI